MISPWSHKSPYVEATVRLLNAINEAAIRDAEYKFAESMRAAANANTAPDHVSNTHATNIRDDLAALIDESPRS